MGLTFESGADSPQVKRASNLETAFSPHQTSPQLITQPQIPEKRTGLGPPHLGPGLGKDQFFVPSLVSLYTEHLEVGWKEANFHF